MFLVVHKDEILARAGAGATGPGAAAALFLAELAGTLSSEQGLAARVTSEEISAVAARHGRESGRAGVAVADLVHGYGALGAAIVELATELGSPISTDEFRTVERCLDEAVAQAVTEHGRQRELAVSRPRMNRLGFLTHELRTHLVEAIGAFESLKSGRVGIASSTGAVLGRSLLAMRRLVEPLLSEVRREADRARSRIPGDRRRLPAPAAPQDQPPTAPGRPRRPAGNGA